MNPSLVSRVSGNSESRVLIDVVVVIAFYDAVSVMQPKNYSIGIRYST
jgi:hypothetical protein